MNLSDVTPINSLWREWTFLNPNYNSSIEFEGLVFPTLRHALEATKTQDMEEREALIKQHPFWVQNWGSLRPFADDPKREEWREEINDLTLILTAQKFGLVDTSHLKAKIDDRTRMKLGFWLTLSGGRYIRYENVNCDLYWGICFCEKHRNGQPAHAAPGKNELGKAMMLIRSKLIQGLDNRQFLSGSCDWCHINKRQTVTPAYEYILYMVNGDLVCRSYCQRHYRAEKHEARKLSHGNWFTYSIHDLPPEVTIATVTRTHISNGRRSSSWQPPLVGFREDHRSPIGFRNHYCSADRGEKDVFGHLAITPSGQERNYVVSAV